MRKIIFSLFMLFIFTGCTHLASVSTSTIPKKKSNKVVVSTEKMIFFAFNFDNNYVNTMAESLAQKCPDGKVQGVLTKHENITYFPLIAHKVRVTAEGYCVK